MFASSTRTRAFLLSVLLVQASPVCIDIGLAMEEERKTIITTPVPQQKYNLA